MCIQERVDGEEVQSVKLCFESLRRQATLDSSAQKLDRSDYEFATKLASF